MPSTLVTYNMSVPAHWVMIAGRAEMMIEYEEGKPSKRVISAGDLVVIPKGAYHSTFSVGWEPVVSLR